MSPHVGEANTGLLGNTSWEVNREAVFLQDTNPFNNNISQPLIRRFMYFSEKVYSISGVTKKVKS